MYLKKLKSFLKKCHPKKSFLFSMATSRVISCFLISECCIHVKRLNDYENDAGIQSFSRFSSDSAAPSFTVDSNILLHSEVLAAVHLCGDLIT